MCALEMVTVKFRSWHLGMSSTLHQYSSHESSVSADQISGMRYCGSSA